MRTLPLKMLAWSREGPDHRGDCDRDREDHTFALPIPPIPPPGLRVDSGGISSAIPAAARFAASDSRNACIASDVFGLLLLASPPLLPVVDAPPAFPVPAATVRLLPSRRLLG